MLPFRQQHGKTTTVVMACMRHMRILLAQHTMTLMHYLIHRLRRINQNVPGSVAIQSHALAAAGQHAAAETGFLHHAHMLMHAQSEFPKTELLPVLDIDPADLDVHAKRAGIE